MTDQVRPEEAARALTEIGQRQEQVIRLAIIPNWYWWASVRGRRAHHHRAGGVPRGP